MEPGLPDELLLLALHDTKGSVIPAAEPVLNGTLVGAVMMELALRGQIQEHADHTLSADPNPIGDDILDDVRQRIAGEPHQKDGRAWVERLSRQLPALRDRLLERLVAAGVLEQRDRRVLWIFPSRTFPLADGATEQQARDRIRAVVLDGQAPDERTAALITLVHACNLLDEIFAPDERPRARRRIVELVTGEMVEDGSFGSGLGAVALFGVVGATLYWAYQKLRQSAGSGAYWDPNILTPWVDTWALIDSDSDSSSSTWADSGVPAGSFVDSSSSMSSAADPVPADGGTTSDSGSSSGGWSWWWWGGGSDSGSSDSNDNSSSDNSGGSWWDSFTSSDSGSSDSGGSWDSGSSDSGGGDSGSSSC